MSLTEFELTEDDVNEMLDILNLPVMCIAGRWPSDLLRMKWCEVAERLGFDVDTIVPPQEDGDVRKFKAEPKP